MSRTPRSDVLLDLRNERINNILESIRDKGICPPSKLGGAHKLITSTNTESDDTTTSVNFVCIKSTEEIAHVAATLCYEEYTGIFGIGVERTYPFENTKIGEPINTPEAIHAEMQARVESNIVFILSPAKYYGIHTSSKKKIFVYTKDDAINGILSQTRASLLIDGTDEAGDAVSEIKTPYSFSIKEIHAIMVPEDLYELVCRIYEKYDRDKIIKVPYKEVTFVKIPNLLEIMHGQKLEKGIKLRVPDYEGAFTTRVLDKSSQLSVHAVRLPARYDFIGRYSPNLRILTESLNHN